MAFVRVKFTYNEDSNIIMTITEGASQLRGPEFFRDKQLLPGYLLLGLSRTSASLKNINRQEQIKLSEKAWTTKKMVVVVVFEIITLYLVQTGRLLAAIGYVARKWSYYKKRSVRVHH